MFSWIRCRITAYFFLLSKIFSHYKQCISGMTACIVGVIYIEVLQYFYQGNTYRPWIFFSFSSAVWIAFTEFDIHICRVAQNSKGSLFLATQHITAWRILSCRIVNTLQALDSDGWNNYAQALFCDLYSAVSPVYYILYRIQAFPGIFLLREMLFFRPLFINPREGSAGKLNTFCNASWE